MSKMGLFISKVLSERGSCRLKHEQHSGVLQHSMPTASSRFCCIAVLPAAAAGLVIALCGFWLLPAIFESTGVELGLVGLVIGTGLAAWAEYKSAVRGMSGWLATWLLLAAAVLLRAAGTPAVVPALVAGMVIYSACGDVLPDTASGWLTAVAAAIGFAAGILVIIPIAI